MSKARKLLEMLTIDEGVDAYFPAEDKMKKLMSEYVAAKRANDVFSKSGNPDVGLLDFLDDPDKYTSPESKAAQKKLEIAKTKAKKFFPIYLAAYLGEDDVGGANYRLAMAGYSGVPELIRSAKEKSYDMKSAVRKAKELAPKIVKYLFV